MAKPVRLLILGTGGMAQTHAAKFQQDGRVEVVACADTNREKLAAFQKAWRINRAFGSLDEALAWGEFEAVSNVTPDAAHFRTTMRSLNAGKHVFCEKPLATNFADAKAMADAAEAAGLVNMINLSYRAVPAMQKAASMVRAGKIGTVRHFEASYLQSWLVQPAWGHWQEEAQWLWRLSSAHGSKGVLGDIGIHVLDFATFVAGQGVAEVDCRLATFEKAAGNKIGNYVLDASDSAVLQVVLENGALGTISASRFASGHLNDLKLRIYGDKGGLEVAWENNKSRLRACLAPHLEAARWSTIRTPKPADNFKKFISAITSGSNGSPSFRRGAELQAILDRAEVFGQQGRNSR